MTVSFNYSQDQANFLPKGERPPVSVKVITMGEIAARYHPRLILHFIQPPNNLRTPEFSLKSKMMTTIADMLDDHVARSMKGRNCDVRYIAIKMM